MRLSKFLLHTTKDITSEAKLISHQLMLKSGIIKQISSGVYCWLPLGVKILDKIKCVIKQQLDDIDSHEIILPSLQPLSIWEKSGRALEESDLKSQIFHLADKKQNKYVLPPSGEEAITDLFNSSVQSYKNVNKILYQITWKFRDEIRPRHGVMRAKEFLMKDAYSFDISKEHALLSYEKILATYLKIFKELELEVIPVLAPTGAMGGDYSHEFHVLAQNGESLIYYQNELLEYLKNENFSLKEYEKFYAKEEEKHINENIGSLNILQSKSIEVGHLFYLGQKYSKDLNCTYQDKDGSFKFPEMGCYGIGMTRLMAAIIESSNDENGIIWPDSISPFKLAIINIKTENPECAELADRIYAQLSTKHDILYDDVNNSPGKKFADMDLIGISWQIIIGPKHATNKSIELKNRKTSATKILKEEELYNFINEL